jgi:hypothetical protein
MHNLHGILITIYGAYALDREATIQLRSIHYQKKYRQTVILNLQCYNLISWKEAEIN